MSGVILGWVSSVVGGGLAFGGPQPRTSEKAVATRRAFLLLSVWEVLTISALRVSIPLNQKSGAALPRCHRVLWAV